LRVWVNFGGESALSTPVSKALTLATFVDVDLPTYFREGQRSEASNRASTDDCKFSGAACIAHGYA
jgi:hypothetical protein